MEKGGGGEWVWKQRKTLRLLYYEKKTNCSHNPCISEKIYITLQYS